MKQTQNHFLKFATSQIENEKKMMICFDGNIDAGVNVSIDESNSTHMDEKKTHMH